MQLIDNLSPSNHLKKLIELISTYDNIILCAGWIKMDGVNLISESLRLAVERGANITVVSNDKNTEPLCVEHLKRIKVNHFLPKKGGNVRYFHTKIYYFEGKDKYAYIIGSANITKGALTNNEELSVCISGVIGDQNHIEIEPYIKHIREKYFV
jgi:HKD family nuclease